MTFTPLFVPTTLNRQTYMFLFLLSERNWARMKKEEEEAEGVEEEEEEEKGERKGG